METSVIAKPYANALSMLDINHSAWLVLLKSAAALSKNALVNALLSSPKLSKQSKSKAIIALLEKQTSASLSAQQRRFVQLIIEYNRFAIIPSVLQLFAQNSTTASRQVNISTAYDLNATERENLSKKLTKIYQSDVSLNSTTDPNLLGGAVISSGDKVRNHSICAKLEKLAAVLSSK